MNEINITEQIRQQLSNAPKQKAFFEFICDQQWHCRSCGISDGKIPAEQAAGDGEIQSKFQLLKKDGSGNHNLLKSRACEYCLKTGNRGTPFGIKFWYEGNRQWDNSIPSTGKKAEQGCIGCGWYDFEKWRNALNEKLNSD